jgi:hypothetical protein
MFPDAYASIPRGGISVQPCTDRGAYEEKLGGDKPPLVTDTGAHRYISCATTAREHLGTEFSA